MCKNLEDIKIINKKIIKENGEVETFSNQLLDLIDGNYDSGYPMVISDNSDPLSFIDDLNKEKILTINVSTIVKLRDKHNESYRFISEIYQKLSDSLFAFESLTRERSIIILLAESTVDNIPYIATCYYDKKIGSQKGAVVVNEITSIYDRERFNNLLQRTWDADLKFYKNKKTERIFRSTWLQLPTELKYALSSKYNKQSFNKSQVAEDLIGSSLADKEEK